MPNSRRTWRGEPCCSVPACLATLLWLLISATVDIHLLHNPSCRHTGLSDSLWTHAFHSPMLPFGNSLRQTHASHKRTSVQAHKSIGDELARIQGKVDRESIVVSTLQRSEYEVKRDVSELSRMLHTEQRQRADDASAFQRQLAAVREQAEEQIRCVACLCLTLAGRCTLWGVLRYGVIGIMSDTHHVM